LVTYTLQHIFLMNWLVLYEEIKEEQQLHNLLFLLQLGALSSLNEITKAGFGDFMRVSEGVRSFLLNDVLKELQDNKLIDDFTITPHGKEVFREMSSLLLYDKLYKGCLPISERYQNNMTLIEKDIFNVIPVKRAKIGETIFPEWM